MSNKYSQGVASDGAAILNNGQPMKPDEIVNRLNEKITLRQYYAGQALVGIFSNHVFLKQMKDQTGPEEFANGVANACVNLADALIKAEES